MPNKAIPDRLKDFMVYKNGTTDLMGVADIQLPSFSFATEEVKAAGVFGSFESSTGSFGSQKIALNWHSITERMIDFLELVTHRLDCRGALQEHDRSSGKLITRALRVVVQGHTTNGEL
ncbi:phage major tail tube protein, partial [Lactobacillus crispatus]|uniref:phage major tail tube protein n=1 Tax=Lactobacillus crispatus TaxID=47770 RepID=UPI0029C28A98